MLTARVVRAVVAMALAAGCLVGTAAVANEDSAAERRGSQALQSLQYPWRDLGYSVEFREYQGGQLGSANSRTKRIVIYVKRSQSEQSLRATIAHELGHALDFEHATVARRDDYRVIRRIDRRAQWYPCDRCSDYASHAGDWAEVFAYWLAGPGDFRSRVAGPPTRDQLQRLAPLFRIPSEQAQPGASPRPSPSPTRSPNPLEVGDVLPTPPVPSGR